MDDTTMTEELRKERAAAAIKRELWETAKRADENRGDLG